MRYEHLDHMNAGGWMFAAVMLVLMLFLGVAAILWLTRVRRIELTPQAAVGAGADSARDLLDRQLVAGEIGEEEYRRLRVTLAASASSASSENPPPEPR